MSGVGALVTAAGVGVALALAAGHPHHHHHEHATLTAASDASTSSSNEQLGMAMAAARGWSGGQAACLNWLWTRESGWQMVWNTAGSGAYGIPQSLPASKMAAAGADWMTSPRTQIRWGLRYIRGRYGSPCAAWAHETNSGWY